MRFEGDDDYLSLHQYEMAEREGRVAKRRLSRLFDQTGVATACVAMRGRPATADELATVHDRRYVGRILDLDRHGGSAGPGTQLGPGGASAAAVAAGSAIVAVDAVATGTVKRAFALTSRAGHHARVDRGSGFCVFNNAALAAQQALRAGARRVAIVDWDAHHGNGTQELFEDRADVLTVSLHQELNVEGWAGTVAAAAALEACINIPLAFGSGDAAYRLAMDEVVAPALRSFQPDFLLVACGLDPSIYDPMARMAVTASGFATLSSTARDLAEELCGGRLVMTLEGGYSPLYTPWCGVSVIAALVDGIPSPEDPFAKDIQSLVRRQAAPHEVEAIEAAASQVELVRTD
jgi:acetoin utilization deacetylase AcuC-like enzyme